MRVSISGKGFLQSAIILDTTTKKPKCYRFSRVAYALPPTGARRWRKPEPLPDNFSYGSENDPGVYTKPCSPCPQPSNFGVISADEDCLQLNIYVPLEPPPKIGWPVFFYIHGGFLQFGSNASDNPSSLISETDVKCIIVSPGYRLGIFGFLASQEISEGPTPTANFGFWDQRLALEWTYDNIAFFGGNSSNITIGGLSAGSYATFHQLAHDLGPNVKRQIIRRVIQWSNGCGVEPKRVSEAQEQFDDLVSTLGIPRPWTATKKLEVLRSKSAEELIKAVEKMEMKFFRPILDGQFMSENLFEDLFNGAFGKRMKDLGIQTMIGDLTQEWHLYKMTYPPTSYETLVKRLSWDYPRGIAIAISEPYRFPSQRSNDEWRDIFGKLYADMQIHSTMRGFIQSVSNELPLDHIHRYRIDYRTQSVDRRLPKEVGATHGTDLSIWLFGNGQTLDTHEKVLIREWLRPVAAFLNGEIFRWGTQNLTEVRYLTADGRIEIRPDEVWNAKIPLWETTKKVTTSSRRKRNIPHKL